MDTPLKEKSIFREKTQSFVRESFWRISNLESIVISLSLALSKKRANGAQVTERKKNVKKTHGGVLPLVKLQAVTFFHFFSRFLNCANGSKSRKVSHLFEFCLDTSHSILKLNYCT